MKDCKRVECMGSNSCIDLCWKKEPKQEQGEPVAITITGKLGNIYSFTGDYSLKKGDKVYTKPTQRTWVGLTDDQKLSLEIQGNKADVLLAELVEQWLKEKNK